MKKIFAAAVLSFVLFSCTDTKKQEQDLLNEVIKVHDQVMAKDELVITNKMQLDTLLKQNKAPDVNMVATGLTKQLDTADAHMENWMHKFDAENTGKSHDQVMKYLADQKKQIQDIDKELNEAIASSAKFIKENKAK
ncbi:hypothetical protein FFF34_005520 [Inquilinus sp. KBS0705]|nr:hypothetical protein FFF34_005520 [Inquilinus sp. KBS0705]